MSDTIQRPRIGDFVKPTPVPPPGGTGIQAPTRPPIAVSVSTSATTDDEALLDKVESKETDVEREAKHRLSLYEEMQQALLPVQDYKKFLREHEISETTAETIVDALLVKGFYEENIPLSKRVNMTLRTREHRDLLRLQAMIQANPPLFQNVMDELTTRHNIAASLVEFNGQRFDHPSSTTDDKVADEMFDKRMVFVERISTPVFNKISVKLAQFDRKIAAIMREGVAENF